MQLINVEGRGPEPLEITKFELPRSSQYYMLTKDEKLELSMQLTMATVLEVPLILINEALEVQLQFVYLRGFNIILLSGFFSS